MIDQDSRKIIRPTRSLGRKTRLCKLHSLWKPWPKDSSWFTELKNWWCGPYVTNYRRVSYLRIGRKTRSHRTKISVPNPQPMGKKNLSDSVVSDLLQSDFIPPTTRNHPFWGTPEWTNIQEKGLQLSNNLLVCDIANRNLSKLSDLWAIIWRHCHLHFKKWHLHLKKWWPTMITLW